MAEQNISFAIGILSGQASGTYAVTVLMVIVVSTYIFIMWGGKRL